MGESSFFLLPGESIPNGIQEIVLLARNEGLIVRAVKDCEFDGQMRNAGERWIIYGPNRFVKIPEVEVVGKRKALISLEPFVPLNYLYWLPDHNLYVK